MIESPNLIFPVSASFLPNFEILVHSVFLAKIRTGSNLDWINFGLDQFRTGSISDRRPRTTEFRILGYGPDQNSYGQTFISSYQFESIDLDGTKKPDFSCFFLIRIFLDLCELITPFGFLGQDFPSKSSC